MPPELPALHRTIVVVDVASFTDPRGDTQLVRFDELSDASMTWW